MHYLNIKKKTLTNIAACVTCDLGVSTRYLIVSLCETSLYFKTLQSWEDPRADWFLKWMIEGTQHILGNLHYI